MELKRVRIHVQQTLVSVQRLLADSMVEWMSTYGKLLVPDLALYPFRIFVDTCINARCCAATHTWPKTCHTHYRICGDFCSPHLQGSARVTLKIGEKNIITLTIP